MKTILFIHPGFALLPELGAYTRFFNENYGYRVVVCNLRLSEPYYDGVDLVWVIMGIAPSGIPKDIPVVHEYASLATGRFPRLKNLVKRLYSTKPDLRVFLNPWVEGQMHFIDSVPVVYRDMGIWSGFFSGAEHPQKARGKGWLYAGAISRARGLDGFLKQWAKSGVDAELFLAGEPDPGIVERYGKLAGVSFLGRLEQAEIAELARSCSIGLNIVPAKYPYTNQTCTKVLEYCAMGLGVVTTRTNWVQKFELENSMNYFYLSKDYRNLSDVEGYHFSSKDVRHLEWNGVLEQSGVGIRIQELLA